MKTNRIIIASVLVIGLCLGLAGAVYAAGNIDATQKWAWGTNIGWINFNPTHGGVTVYPDHLEGYAWAENIGWIRLGTYTGGGNHTYANSAANNYGVNRTADSKLSGYAWGTNVGWINFHPTHSQVTIDPATGAFDGYAWARMWVGFTLKAVRELLPMAWLLVFAAFSFPSFLRVHKDYELASKVKFFGPLLNLGE